MLAFTRGCIFVVLLAALAFTGGCSSPAAEPAPAALDTPLGAHLLAATHDPDPAVRAAAISGLGESGEAAAPVIQRLLQLMVDSTGDSKLRYGAIQALNSLGEPPAAAISTLAGLLAQDPDENIRYAAVDAIGRLSGSADDATLEALISALDDPSWHVAGRASEVLAESGDKVPRRLPNASPLSRTGPGDPPCCVQ
jgi:HEAT repeat protein